MDSTQITDTLIRTQGSLMQFVPTLIDSVAKTPWVLALTIFLFAVTWLLNKFLGNPILTSALAKRIEDPELADSIKTIKTTLEKVRADQLVSNEERRKQTERLSEIEEDIEQLKSQRCMNGTCPNREHAG